MSFEKVRICKECRKEFVAKSPRQFYCKEDHYRPCPICGKPVFVKPGTWIDPPRTCSKECFVKLHQKTCLEKYGCVDPGNSEHFKEKRKQTCLERYGVENPAVLESSKQKQRETMMKRYGVEYYAQSEEGKQKAKDSWCRKTDEQIEQITDKRRKTWTFKYGVDNPRKSEFVNAKVKQTCLDRYGVECSLWDSNIRKKVDTTLVKRYGSVEFYNNPEVIEKRKQTCLMKYGVKSTLVLDSTLKKARESFERHYGVMYPGQSEELREVAVKHHEAHCGSSYIPSRKISDINRKFANKLNMLGLKIEFEFPVENVHYDIHLLDTNILIEIDSTVTHNTLEVYGNPSTLTKDYHLKRSEIALRNGYRCIHVFGYDNHDKISISLCCNNVVRSESLNIRKVYESEFNEFNISNFHYEDDFDSECVYYGMFSGDDFVCLASFKLCENQCDWNMVSLKFKNRFNTDSISNLLRFHKMEHFDSSIYCKLDLSKEDVDFYLNSGFKYESYIEPQVHLIKNSVHYFPVDETKFDEYVSNGYLPVYDCGYVILKYD